MRDNCLTSRHEENRLIPVASLGIVDAVLKGVFPCVCECVISQCTVLWFFFVFVFVLFLFLFLFISYDVSAGKVLVFCLGAGGRVDLSSFMLVAAPEVMGSPPGTSPVLQREYILIGHNVGCSDLCAWNQLPSLAVNLSWVASLHPREVWYSLYLSDDQRLHTTSCPPITQIQAEKSTSFKVYTQTFTNLNLPRDGLPGWDALMVVQSAVWDVNLWRLLHVSSSSCACSLPFSTVRFHPVWCSWTSRKVHPIELCRGHSLKQMLNLEVWSWSLSLGFRLLCLWPETSRQ